MSRGFLVPNLDYRHHARQVTRLVRDLTDRGIPARVLSLAGDGPLRRELPDGTWIPSTHERRMLPPAGWLTLRDWLQCDAPESIHIWGRSALRAFRIVAATSSRKISWDYSPLVGEKVTRFDSWLLRGCRRLIVPHPDFPGVDPRESTILKPILGIAPETSETCLPSPPLRGRGVGGEGDDLANGLVLSPSPQPSPPQIRGRGSKQSPNLSAHPPIPASAKVILSIGRMDRYEAFQDGFWAFDILRRAVSDIHLVLIGDGLAKCRLEDLYRSLAGSDRRVHFLAEDTKIDIWLKRASLGWIPNDPSGGLHRIAEFLSVDISTLAPRLPHFAGLYTDNPRLQFYQSGRSVELATLSLAMLEN